MACTRMGLPWPEGEASLASELGKLHGFRRWCETPLIEMRVARPAAGGEPPIAPGPLGGGPSAEALFRPVRLHLACKLGRRWLCLNCFGVEEGGVAAFRRARCAGIAPIAEAHRALLNAVVRYGPSAGLTGASQVRLSALWAAAGSQASVFTLALPPERPLEPLLSSVMGRALLREPDLVNKLADGWCCGDGLAQAPEERLRLRGFAAVQPGRVGRACCLPRGGAGGAAGALALFCHWAGPAAWACGFSEQPFEGARGGWQPPGGPFAVDVGRRR